MMEPEHLGKCLLTAISAAKNAGAEILEVYDSDFDVEYKDDKSPLTLADKKSNAVIESYLADTNIPVLSEEGRQINYEERKDWERLWVVDPLDGTKEFVKRNGEFTVNIALVENNKPVLGVIYVPVRQDLYFGALGIGAYKTEGSVFDDIDIENAAIDDLIQVSKKLPIETSRSMFTVIGSRSHMSEETEAYVNGLRKEKGEIEIISAGSAIKLCLVAEGVADEYPRFAPTMEWDTCAGHAIANCAGKAVIDHATQHEMVYNRENLVNNWFIVK